MKKIIILFLIGLLTIFIITGCNGVTPPPPNGTEGEGEEEVQQVVLLEAFVADGCGYCKVIEPSLEQLASEYGRDKMILVQVIPWLSSATENGGDRYKWYSLQGGTPQVLVNGLIFPPLTGTPSYATIKSRVVAQLNASPKLVIQATRTEENGTSIIEGTIKNISDSPLANLVINCMTFKQKGSYPYAATKIYEEAKVSVSSLAAGETKNFTLTLTDANWGGLRLKGVVFVQETTGKKRIYQSLYIK